MLVVLCVIAAALPWTVVEGAKACIAPPRVLQPAECVYDTPVKGANGREIIYKLTLPSERICCEAKSCIDSPAGTATCTFVDIGCRQKADNPVFVSDALPWTTKEPRNPSMRCHAETGTAKVAYSYSAEVILGKEGW